MRALAVMGITISLGACATTTPPAPRIVTKEVVVQVLKPCIPKEMAPAPESYADDGIANVADPVERSTRRAAANQQRRARLAVLEPVVAACR